MDNKGNIEYSPFGSTSSTYSPDIDDIDLSRKKQGKKTNWKVIAGFALAAIIMASLVFNFFYVSNTRSMAEYSIQNMNKQLLNVQSVASNDTIPIEYETVRDNTTTEERKKIADTVINASKYVKENPLTALEPTMNDETATNIVAPYVVLCDSAIVLNNNDELFNACIQLNSAGYDMMGKVKHFNNTVSSFQGKLSLDNGGLLPNISK